MCEYKVERPENEIYVMFHNWILWPFIYDYADDNKKSNPKIIIFKTLFTIKYDVTWLGKRQYRIKHNQPTSINKNTKI